MDDINSRLIANGHPGVYSVMQSKHLAFFMVLGAVASYREIMPPSFIEVAMTINTRMEYLKILEEVILPWIKKSYDPKKVVCIQDFAPAHGSNLLEEREFPLFCALKYLAL